MHQPLTKIVENGNVILLYKRQNNGFFMHFVNRLPNNKLKKQKMQIDDTINLIVIQCAECVTYGQLLFVTFHRHNDLPLVTQLLMDV